MLWVRISGWGTLSLTGKRLDGKSAPMSAGPGEQDKTYPYPASELSFPTSGCWQVDANEVGESLRFVVQIR